jgi:hypothetical protein
MAGMRAPPLSTSQSPTPRALRRLAPSRPQALFGGSNNKEMKQTKKGFSRRSKQTIEDRPKTVEYGSDWYQQTREAAKPRRTPREEMEYRRQANLEANNGKDRKDLYTDNWDGDVYKGSPVNILSILIAVSLLVPVAGLVFAYQTYGVLWG